jgi:hypothetical protein
MNQTTAFPSPHVTVRLVGGVYCPHCRRELRAGDVAVFRGNDTLVCRGCHQDVLTIERK